MSGEKRHITVDFRYYLQDEHQVKHGTRWGLCSATTIDYLGDRAILTNITDITDSKEIENFLRIQDKMASLGRVTAGIAHEIRNPLSGVYIYLKTLRRIYNNYGDINKVISLIDKIENASAKIESIIKRVMDFSKPGTPNFVETDLNPCIDDVTKLTAVTLRKKGVKFIKNLDPDLPKCWTDPHLIEQVILNLITNAAEAVKEAKGEHIIEVSSSKNKGHIVIKVSDSGPGIPHSHQNKIFDPFYTTKTNNSGIGLSICHRIITDHGGSLKYNPGKLGGADFIIEIPLDRQNGNADL